jgi:ATP-dependent Clp protease ATP-binding subunit ClpC
MLNVEVLMSDQLSTRSGSWSGIGNAMMNDFTPHAQQILALAHKEAERFNHNYMGTEHLLVGQIKLGQEVPVLSATDSTCRVTFISLSFYQQLQSRSLVS